jgi:hypothetical protein
MCTMLHRQVLLFAAFVACDSDPVSTERGGVVEPQDASSDTSPCTRGPRWVLRDKHGTAVPALVEPSCGLGYATVRCRGATDFGPSIGYPCVRVIDFDGQYVNVGYELASGMIQPCQGGFWDQDLKWSDADWVVYADASCTGIRYSGTNSEKYGGLEFTEAQALNRIEGKLWSASGTGCIQSSYTNWRLDSQGTCIYDEGSENFTVCPYQEVPSWVINMLSNPPYTLGVEYE